MNAIRGLWLRWKGLKLPWRKRFLVGYDLNGHTYWEFKDTINAQRMRRTVKYSRSTHYSDVQVPPQWHQWLRHTRYEPPSMQEQQAEMIRQAQMKQLARVADERWASIPSYLDKPKQQQLGPATIPRDPAGDAPPTEPEDKQGVRDAISGPKKTRFPKGQSPFQQQKGGPSENWQPEAWMPGALKR